MQLPMAAEPELPAGVTVVAEGRRTSVLGSGESLGLDAVEVAGANAPPCAALVAAWTWAAATSGVPANSLLVNATRMGSTTELGRGASGAVPSGCAWLSFMNTGDQAVDIEVQFAIGALGQQ
jgi:hypothetical protein